METPYTKGKLQAIHGSYLTIVGTDESIGRCGIHGPHMENARRLAACWNACIGIDTAFLEDKKFTDCSTTHAAIAQRDELRNVLQEIIRDGVHCDVVPHLHRAAIDVITKVGAA